MKLPLTVESQPWGVQADIFDADRNIIVGSVNHVHATALVDAVNAQQAYKSVHSQAVTSMNAATACIVDLRAHITVQIQRAEDAERKAYADAIRIEELHASLTKLLEQYDGVVCREVDSGYSQLLADADHAREVLK